MPGIMFMHACHQHPTSTPVEFAVAVGQREASADARQLPRHATTVDNTAASVGLKGKKYIVQMRLEYPATWSSARAA
jgi:hypothetical protein